MGMGVGSQIQSLSLVEVSLGDGNEVGVDGSHDANEGWLTSEGREDTTKLTREGYVEQVLGRRGEGRGGEGSV